ncbi:alpha/beta hydrolase [Polynucleobacter paneuropaeus]|jgi:carboxylesterase|uniref:alpha/beta hydrolase n=1 Tax=Polynucleobacter paneuropaeus TaxID=2527775 RepID=UPI001BFDDB8F|nr:alpha/beta fold hydrolase [Polynucleobacter paneuropaeus]MBT8555960.1 alpha/beta fold hydrolase [Polynucleobacter paneuropaeus]MBT8572270.1 alpha/beta fold hydrolase [Polynucleobacter paneuropaeus]MBT8612320.1 alpha/beta fold hydrolase [Polynucleobacter paneuropaeus]MBT8635046.1 alpha/beta fold hydrolase [Polynucleobacter paneuropaeus]QWD11725.1 alpha/beta fold hydrolase [Polynucleobacter paneuropaeus]
MTSIAEQPDRYETFYQGNTGHAVVLLPGLCGSELEMGAIPRLLKQSNHTYTIPRIKGYSAHTGLTGYQEWIDSVDQFVTDLSQTHDSISIAGLSMGATLALAVAEQNSKVHSLVILSPVFLFDGWSVPWYYPFLALLYKIGIRNWHFKEREPFGVKNVELRRHIQKAVMANSVSELGAAHLPAVHLYQSLELVKATKKELSSITADTLIIHAVDDETASPKNPEIIIDSIASETCRMIWLGNSYHMITVDNEREVVANEVNNFINQTIEKEKIVDRLSIDTPSLVIKNRNRS